MEMTPISVRDSLEKLPRSAESRAFEAFWSGLRREGLMPRRQDLRPSHAVRFLDHLVLMELPDPDTGAMRVRLSGTAIDARAGRTLVGANYLECVPPHLRAGVVRSARLMYEHPCGLWQVMPIHFESGVALDAEVTAFPLLPAENAAPLLVMLVRFPGGRLVPPTPFKGSAILVDPATQYEFLDVGAGAPHYP